MGVWDFIQNQVLGMQWLNALIGMGLSAIGLDVTGRIGGSIQFFIYDVLKITVLLCVLIFAIASSKRSFTCKLYTAAITDMMPKMIPNMTDILSAS